MKKINTGFDFGEQSINVCFKTEFAVKPDTKILVGFNNIDLRAIKYKYFDGTFCPWAAAVEEHEFGFIGV